jgi:hypothetical protein
MPLTTEIEMKFRPTLPLTTANAADAQPGQWFRRPDGTLTQYVGMRETRTGVVVPHFSDAGQTGEGFEGRTQRFARARWHLAHRHGGLVELVKRAPRSVDDALLGRFARQSVAIGA